MASTFISTLKSLTHDLPSPKHWVFIPYDQLTDQLGPLAKYPPKEVGIIMVESSWKGSRRPYHKMKLALLLGNMRHFALEQARRGVKVKYVFCDTPYHEALEGAIEALEPEHPVLVMRPAEYELRCDLQPLLERGVLKEVPHEGWLTTQNLFIKSQGKRKSWRMDAFYKKVRVEHDILMDDEGEPEGGKFSLDAQNRQPWKGEPPAPALPSWTPDEITKEVCALVEDRFGNHPGKLTPTQLPTTQEDAQKLWDWAKRECMTHFGPYEDAMTVKHHVLFHTQISPLLNLHRLVPRVVLEDVLELEIPLNSKEGFVRQLIGWREFMHHVHETTQGLRQLPASHADPETLEAPGDANYEDYSKGAWSQPSSDPGGVAGADANVLGANEPLPPAFWGEPTGLACLDHAVDTVMTHGWSHHIERLMILSNLATLLDIRPRELTDWFWSAYMDAYDWVVEPNVLGMGTFGLGELFVTKPYVSGSNYIDKMSDFCASCTFHPKKTCPITSLYWNFLARHEETLGENHRMGLVYGNLRRRSDEQKSKDARAFEIVSQALGRGEVLEPKDFEEK